MSALRHPVSLSGEVRRWRPRAVERDCPGKVVFGLVMHGMELYSESLDEVEINDLKFEAH